MKAHEFVLELLRVSPSKEDYLAFGFSEGLATELSKEYNFTPSINEAIILGGTPKDEMISLLNSYNVDAVQIGLVSFLSRPEESKEFIYLGRVELDVLALNKTNFEIVVLDHDDLTWIIWPCAASSERFLDALLTFASFLSYKVKNKIAKDRDEVAHECALLCSEKAGGSKYFDFYKMLLGLDE